MPQSVADLEQRRAKLIAEMSRLDDLRPGCITGIVRRCGKPTCHCAKAGDAGHGPTLRLTYKAEGKTITSPRATICPLTSCQPIPSSTKARFRAFSKAGAFSSNCFSSRLSKLA
jgi:hypothetical protein